mmetsp:Transcript_144369/g.249909  ORF Transcript_144369/g.249909 Transcript_144369/m.249909 type:complete len:269 (+) Transcript_144369:407-1213(+)
MSLVPGLQICFEFFLCGLVTLQAQIIIAASRTRVSGASLAAHVAKSFRGNLLHHFVSFRAHYVLRWLFVRELIPYPPHHIVHEPNDGYCTKRQEHGAASWILHLLTIAAPSPALEQILIPFLSYGDLECAILRDYLDGVVLSFDPLKATLEKYRAQVLRDASLPLASGPTSSRCVLQLCIVGAADGDELGALVCGRVELHEDLTAPPSHAPEWRHLIRLRTVWRTLPRCSTTHLFLLLSLVKHVLPHSWQLAAATIDVCLRGNLLHVY